MEGEGSDVEYRNLGQTDLRVSRICLGTMTFGAQVSENDAIAIVHEALDLGINFIDTANVYVKGASEIITGKALAGRRDQVILASKCAGAMSDDPADKGLSRAIVLRHVDDSLTRLGTEYLDLLYLHFPDYNTPIEEIAQTMGELIKSGKIRHYGVSNFPAWMCCALWHVATALNVPTPVATENVYNVITRSLDSELLPFLRTYPLSLVTFNPLAGGLLTGKHAHGDVEPGTRLDVDRGYALRYLKPANIEAADKLAELANQEGRSATELAYQWLLGKNYITSVICGVSKASHLAANVAACDAAPASPETLAQCDLLWSSIKGDYFDYHY